MKQSWEPELKHLPAQLSCLCPCLPQDRSKSTAYVKQMQKHQESPLWRACRSVHSLQRVEFGSSAEHRALKCGKCRALSWCRRGWRTGRGLISCIKIRIKMKPALGNLSALSKHFIENKRFLQAKVFTKNKFNTWFPGKDWKAEAGVRQMWKMDGIYCIYIQKPESEIDLIR